MSASLTAHGRRVQLALAQLCPHGSLHLRTPLVTVHHLDKLGNSQRLQLPVSPEQLRTMAKRLVSDVINSGDIFEEPVLAYVHVGSGPLPDLGRISTGHYYFLLPLKPGVIRPMLWQDIALQHLAYMPILSAMEFQHAYAIHALCRVPTADESARFFAYFTHHDLGACEAESDAAAILSTLAQRRDAEGPRKRRRGRPPVKALEQ
jgi:hypothetical protein